MGKIRALVVDDSVVTRRLVSEVLAGDPDFEVVAVAANGRQALAKLEQLRPDVVTLDVEMPELDGLETLRELRRLRPTLPVVMFSAATLRGAAVTVEALTLGANDYVAKPADAGDVQLAMRHIRDELLPRLKALCRPASAAPIAELPRGPRLLRPAVRLLAIGCSTGGPNALAQLLPLLPASFPVPIVIVQHMPPVFTRLLAERLDLHSAIAVAEGAPGVALRPGAAFIAPGDFHMRVQRGLHVTLAMEQGPPEHSCRPAVDVLFESVADVFGSGVLGVVLTGMGQDGLRGSERIRAAGGEILAQDEASSVVWGMPGNVARARLASEVLPLGEIAAAILRRVGGDVTLGRTRKSSP